MCKIKILINVEQNAYWLIITSVLRSECWVFTEPLEHPENTPMMVIQKASFNHPRGGKSIAARMV